MKSSTESPDTATSAAAVAKGKEQKQQLKTTNKMETLESAAASVTCFEHSNISNWQVEDVLNWAETVVQCSKSLLECLSNEAIDGQVLLVLTEEDIRDMRYKLNYQLTFGEMKKFWLAVQKLQPKTKELPPSTLLGLSGHLTQAANAAAAVLMPPLATPCPCPPECPSYISDCEVYFSARKKRIPPEYFKTAISLCYSFLVTWITSFVMVIVHERVPDMKRYPPLPDIFLDNVPHIPWAFNMCEVTGTLLFSIWIIVIIFHKYRTVVLRRFFALAGTVFLLRCVTMLITSLSVPGTHLQCNQKDFAIDDADLDLLGCLWVRMRRAYTIWSGLGMSIQGVRTCGDYMFSGHTVALTLLNFFITEYTPRNLYFLHTLTWLLNMFGIFFILAAHEHYSIDVFVAFYITSRLFLYYHTLSNNQALMQSDSTRTRIWFPMFSYFESNVEGIIPNDYDSFTTIIDNLLHPIINLKDFIMLTAHRIWLDPPTLLKSSEHLLNGSSAPSSEAELSQRNVTTSPYYSIHSNNAAHSDLLVKRHQNHQHQQQQQQQQPQMAKQTMDATQQQQQPAQQQHLESETEHQGQRFPSALPVNRPKSVSTLTSFESSNEVVNTKKRL